MARNLFAELSEGMKALAEESSERERSELIRRTRLVGQNSLVDIFSYKQSWEWRAGRGVQRLIVDGEPDVDNSAGDSPLTENPMLTTLPATDR